MKLLKKIMIALTVLSVFSFTGCDFLNKIDKIGKELQEKDKPDKTGDIIFANGHAISILAIESLSNDDRHRVIAYAYKINSDGSVMAFGSYAMDCYQPWCYGANANSIVIEPIVCEVSGDIDNYTFDGDTDGSDNFAQLKAFLKSIGKDDTEDYTDDDGDPYRAFHKGQTYMTDRIKKQSYFKKEELRAEFKQGWYIPSIAELYELYKNKSSIELEYAENLDLYSWAWSSSQVPGEENKAWALNFKTGEIFAQIKGRTRNEDSQDGFRLYVRKFE